MFPYNNGLWYYSFIQCKRDNSWNVRGSKYTKSYLVNFKM